MCVTRQYFINILVQRLWVSHCGGRLCAREQCHFGGYLAEAQYDPPWYVNLRTFRMCDQIQKKSKKGEKRKEKMNERELLVWPY